MNYTVPYNGTFCSKKKILKKRVPSAEAMEIRNYCRSHSFSIEEKSDGRVVYHIEKERK